MNRAVIISLMLLISSPVFCQSGVGTVKKFKQSIYIEFFGNAHSPISLNYERILNASSKNNNFHFSVRIGFGTYRRGVDTTRLYNIPLEVNLIIGKEMHFFETSLGLTSSVGKNFTDISTSPPNHYKNVDEIYTFRLGYRYVGKDGIIFRVAPLLIQLTNYNVPKLKFSFGISGGLSF